MTLAEIVEKHLKQAFVNAAEEIGQIEMTQDEAASVPMAIFSAQNAVLKFWREWSEGGKNERQAT